MQLFPVRMEGQSLEKPLSIMLQQCLKYNVTERNKLNFLWDVIWHAFVTIRIQEQSLTKYRSLQ